VPYWLLQNSWGKGFGEGGFFKMRRGTDECGLETYGLDVTLPVPPAACPAAACKNGAAVQRDCTCRCAGGWAGAACDTCALACRNGGAVADGCARCACPMGFSGAQCEGGVRVSPLAVCAGDRAVLTATFSFGGTAPGAYAPC
jgi:hypothetical protein